MEERIVDGESGYAEVQHRHFETGYGNWHLTGTVHPDIEERMHGDVLEHKHPEYEYWHPASRLHIHRDEEGDIVRETVAEPPEENPHPGLSVLYDIPLAIRNSVGAEPKPKKEAMVDLLKIAHICPQIRGQRLDKWLGKFLAASPDTLAKWNGTFTEVTTAKVVEILRKRGTIEEHEADQSLFGSLVSAAYRAPVFRPEVKTGETVNQNPL